jgi:hypothetical protein
VVQRWLRDVWLRTLAGGAGADSGAAPDETGELLSFPQVPGAEKVAHRISSREAAENLQVMEGLQRVLHTNVQEALALEVGVLKLRL